MIELVAHANLVCLQKIWAEMAILYPPYNDYQKTAGERVIPVVVLDPI